jgi:hypothetical protein
MCVYCAVLKRLATPSDFRIPLPPIVPFAHRLIFFRFVFIHFQKTAITDKTAAVKDIFE